MNAGRKRTPGLPGVARRKLVGDFLVQMGQETVDKFIGHVVVTGTDSVERTRQQEALAREHPVHVSASGFDVVDDERHVDGVPQVRKGEAIQ